MSGKQCNAAASQLLFDLKTKVHPIIYMTAFL